MKRVCHEVSGFSLLNLLIGACLTAVMLVYGGNFLVQIFSQTQMLSISAQAEQQLGDLQRELQRDFERTYQPDADYSAAPVRLVSNGTSGVTACDGLKVIQRFASGEIAEVSYVTECATSADTSFAGAAAFPCQQAGYSPRVVMEKKSVFPAVGTPSVHSYLGGYVCVSVSQITADIRTVNVDSGIYFHAPNKPLKRHLSAFVLNRNVLANLEYK